MGIPVGDEFIKNLVISTQMKEEERELRFRNEKDYRVFISYSHHDGEIAEHITDVFDRATIQYEIDKKELEWGDKIRERVLERLTACTHYLLLLSETSAASQWCSYECGIADGQSKKVLIFLVSAVSMPPFAAPFLATADLDEVERYFSKQLIDEAAVDQFVTELIGDSKAKLETSTEVGKADGRDVWDLPDREGIENARRGPLDDDSCRPSFDRLVRIEIGSAESDAPLVLWNCQEGSRPREYRFTYSDALKAVIVTPEKNGSRALENSSAIQQLRRETIWGWEASKDFWKRTLDKLHTRLVGTQGFA